MTPSPAPDAGSPPLVIAMGVSGCGKTSVGRRVAEHFGWPFQEGDDLHPQANVDKMRRGEPLDDDDRAPWLDAIGDWLDKRRAADGGGVVSCSALKRRYRDRLARSRPRVVFAFLDVSRDELERRLRQREDHYMPASLLDSQLDTLERPQNDEPVVHVDADAGIDTTTQRLIRALHEHRGTLGENR